MAWQAVSPHPPASFVDLGTGGGVPGLVLAEHWPAAQALLLDGSVRRIEFLAEAIDRLGWATRVLAAAARAEDAAATYRGTADLVVARGFGPAAVTAECAAAFVHVDGWVAVAEPPAARPGRWPESGLDLLGLTVGPRVEEPAHVQLLRASRPCPQRYPRRVGVPLKRPLWREPPATEPHRHGNADSPAASDGP